MIIYILLLFLLLSFFYCKNKNIQGLQINKENSLNIYNQELERCTSENSDKPTGYYRDGYCNTGDDDTGTHTVCAKVTDEFLDYTYSLGNDLITPRSDSFKGLEEEDYWCLCALRWKQAYDNNPDLAPQIKTESTHKKTLEFINNSILESKKL